MFENQTFQFMILPFEMALSVDFHQTDGRNSGSFASACHITISVPRRLAYKISNSQQTCISHNTVQSLGFIPNLKKSDLIPAQQFIFIRMEFLTQHNIVRVPADRIESLLLFIKLFLTKTLVSAPTFLSLLGKLSAAADFVLLGRLHLFCLVDPLVVINSLGKRHLVQFVQGTI